MSGVKVVFYARSARHEPAETGASPCHRLREPTFGKGPTFMVVACDTDLVYQGDLGSYGTFRVWRYRPLIHPKPLNRH